MHKMFVFLCISFLFSLTYAQENKFDNRLIVGVPAFECVEATPYAGIVSSRIEELLTNAKRFRVVDRQDMKRLQNEQNLQRTEAFLNSTTTVEQDAMMGAQKLLLGTVTKIPIYREKGPNGNVKGYKCSVAFKLKVSDTETGEVTEAVSFEGKCTKLMLSPESAVQEAMNTLTEPILEYFRVTFPISTKVLKIKDEAERLIVIGVGSEFGVKKGDTFNIETLEMLEGKILPTVIGKVEISNLLGTSFAEGKVSKKVLKNIQNAISAKEIIRCTILNKN